MAKTTEIPLSTFAAATADVDLGDEKLVNVADPTADQDAATKKYVDTTHQTPPHNLLVNGNFDLWQRGTGFDSTTTPANDDDTYLADRWVLLSDGDDVVDVSRQASGGPDGSRYFLRAEVETAGKKFGLVQIVEAANAIPLRGQTVSLSFQARTSSGSSIANLRAAVLAWDGTADQVTSDVVSAWENAGTNPTLAANWTAENTAGNLALSTAWQTFEVEGIQLDTAGLTNLAVFIWVDDTDAAVDDQVDITQVQIEAGAQATAFEPRGIQLEEALAKRYYQRFGGGAYSGYGAGLWTSSTNARLCVALPYELRANPALETGGSLHVLQQNTGHDVTTLAINANDTRVILLDATVASGGAAGEAALLQSDNDTSAYVAFAAEL